MDKQSAIKLPFNLKILPMNRQGIPMGLPFLAMFNPENIAIKEDLEWTDTCAPGAEGSDPTYKKTKGRTFSLELMIDGTGVNTNGIKIPVLAQILLFRSATTHIAGVLHRPPYLLVQYGTFISTCVLNGSTVTYTMFDMFGLPMRAKISASFTERTVPGLSNVLNMLSSPDLTHRRTVKEWDLLPLLTYDIYNNQHYYLQVAKVNRIKNFRKLVPGSEIVFPPVAKK
jgi:Contractile injection system tube protein